MVPALRAIGGLAASVPILALLNRTDHTQEPEAGGTRAGRTGAGIDAYLDAALLPADLVAQANRWQADDEIATVRRLEAVFGVDAIRGLLGGFRAELVKTLATLEWNAPPRAEVAAAAHRLAGIAGTLGFAAVWQDWITLSAGCPVAPDDVYRHLRVAIATIDRVACDTTTD